MTARFATTANEINLLRIVIVVENTSEKPVQYTHK
jgi:hypothetical protein